MANIYMYADETGNLDYAGAKNARAGAYFGFGTAVFDSDHGAELFGGMCLRASIEKSGLSLPKGFHAVDDALPTKNQMFQVIKEQAPRFDTTFLYKANAYESVRARGQMYLYRMAWYLHFKEIATQIAGPNDTLHVIVGTFGTAARRTEAKAALDYVCKQVNRDVVLCVWEASTSWGLQVADYGLWATQRSLTGKKCTWFSPCVQPTLKSLFLPWGRA
ncbi:hypothetical protein WKY82_07240 [Gordonia malaquae]|uniref:hypothetical protein n=1 Tax=Gordonia malaquae TaxID=410332 RepID=UPI0030C7879B